MPLAVRSCHYQASGRRRRRSSGHNRVAGSGRGSCWWLVTPAASQTRALSETMTAIAAGHLLTCPAGQNAVADAVIRATQARRCVVWLMTSLARRQDDCLTLHGSEYCSRTWWGFPTS